jgi:NitT/TauT family transport system ATP-binding protein
MSSVLVPPAGIGVSVGVRGVRKVFPGGVAAVDGIDLDVKPGEFIALLGPSGCGKSTLLRMIAGLETPDSGSIDLNTEASQHGRISFVFQDAHLLPWRNALQNVALPLELMGMDRAKRLSEAATALKLVGLGDALDRYPSALSGGMRMRVSLARALVTNPALLLLDEPFAALDEITRHELDEELHRLWSTRRMTVMFVTHSIIEATFLAERAIVFTRRPARVILDHTLQLPVRRTSSLRTETQFSSQMRILFEALEHGY